MYPSLLEEAGYAVGSMRKAWGPGDFEQGGWEHNPGGLPYQSFEEFFQTVGDGGPFCFFFGSSDAHRPYELGSGEAAGMNPEDVETPPWLPDVPLVRSDICDYYFEIQRFDRELGEALDRIEEAGQLDNTLVIVTSDNGMPFPRAKATVYDSGVRIAARDELAGGGSGRAEDRRLGEPFGLGADHFGGGGTGGPRGDDGK